MKHTPAPWIITGQDIVGHNEYICSWSGRSVNARLIAAAPELLDALEETLYALEGWATLHPNDWDKGDIEAVRKAHTIIEKAG